VHPQPLSIDAGLATIPRQIATFADFRRAMLAAIPTEPPLNQWRPRDQDLGMMLIEMWAYVCDVLGFYDETIAHESYLRTARRDPSVRMLVGLLGYRPRPAVAARVRLAIKATGRLPLDLPAGMAVRSSAFGSEKPQVFELDGDTRVHPLLNGWQLAPTRATTVGTGSQQLLLAPDTARVRVDDHLLILGGGQATGSVHTATGVAKITGDDGAKYVRVDIDPKLATPLTIASSRLLRSTATTALWTNSSDPFVLTTGTTTLHLAGVVPQLSVGGWIVARTATASAAFQMTAVSQSSRRLASGTTFNLPPANAPVTVSTPEVRAPVTAVTISPSWPAALGTAPTTVTIDYNFQDAGALTAELDDRIAADATLHLLPPIEKPPDGTDAGRFLVADTDATAAELAGGIDFGSRTLNLAQASVLPSALRPPATAYANIGDFSRGETVPSETLGVGDASVASQSFVLKKSPLTYTTAPATAADQSGVRSTLRVWVDGVEWQEVGSFFGATATSTVYHVRQDDAGDSRITFGDGARGARLPSGAVVVCSYRFGAGAVSPPAGGLTQLAKPVKDVAAVINPVAAAGGADRQPASQVRRIAPRSALLFGRAVSIADIEALAAGQPGVRAVQARWSWDAQMQQPVIQIWFNGPGSIAAAVQQSLRAATAPSTPIKATPATALAVAMNVTVRVAPTHQVTLVRDAVLAALTEPDTGPLVPEVIGVGAPVFRSQLLAEILAVPGVTAVDSLIWQGAPFADYGTTPGEGAWFDVTATVIAREADHD
jgi:predicted phage baseplate assembly protein